ncbi:ATP-binding cassette domain-containing protein [Paenibacillus mucilaginosus]|uniref:ABC transporter ATP-binding protein n=1 Tax=Paenibacillus mucilaginosus (strain KNP414) TaxID=1036673 RepID=F8F879_PAEMK|nr:ABC transporter ATP-binding protein [Paenibacillus mucilaginosus]AEI41064.1 ABC transporter ATP-binding protein [Paenibacillus mucilaginosus KNP414]MCG7211493.1 ABC transporter ATP-binding protein [Paenibacillus mucilaginosus]WDM30132.1 ABC transporter ATP-binding protein [Paenibacillus mucilaginosus]
MIEISRISKKYGRKRVLNEVTFTAEKGQITCLIGLNGAGKSTILKAVMGLTPVSGGDIRIDGEPVTPRSYERVSFIPDSLTMPPGMRIEEAMRFMADFYPNWNPPRAEELLSFFQLNRKDKIGDLSKGTAAKVNLMLGLSLDADYVLMDEPFSGIDIFSREQIASVFTTHLIEDRGVIITTHEIHDIEHLIDKVVLLDGGRVYREFSAEDVRMQEGKSVVDVMREVYRA